MAPISSREISNIIRYSTSDKMKSLSTIKISIFFSPLLSLLELASTLILMDSISNLQSFNSRSQVLNSCSTPSLPSEPPDIGNWFSSYEYNTPGPYSNVNLEDSAPRVCEFKKDEATEGGEANFKELVADEKIVKSNIDFERDKHEDGFSVKSVDPFSPHSFLSEPPDIRNWLSSYAYESFVLDTINLCVDSGTKERESGGEGYIFKGEIEDEVRCEVIQPKGSLEHNISSPHKDLKVKKPSSWDEEKILQPCLHESTLQHDNCLIKPNYAETLSLNLSNPECNQEATLLSADINARCSDYNCIRPPDVEDIRETRSNAKMQHENLDTGVNLANRFSRDEELKNGFVSTRKNWCYQANDENFCNRSQEMLSKDSSNSGTVSLACEKHAVVKRKALAEATNYQQSSAKEIIGKWQCPQKGKPSAGPALKQLRLERWLHRA